MQEQLEDYTIKINEKIRENKKHMKEKEEAEKLLINEWLCIDVHHSCHYNVIREEN